MTVDTLHFTPWESLAGGALIGLACALLWLGNGRIAGMTGMLAGILLPVRGDALWRAIFVLGLLCGGLLVQQTTPAAFGAAFDRSLWVIGVGGLLVGVGTRLGGGCTSGHGVCGLARFSPRSVVATGVFMAVGMSTAVVFGRLGGAA